MFNWLECLVLCMSKFPLTAEELVEVTIPGSSIKTKPGIDPDELDDT